MLFQQHLGGVVLAERQAHHARLVISHTILDGIQYVLVLTTGTEEEQFTVTDNILPGIHQLQGGHGFSQHTIATLKQLCRIMAGTQRASRSDAHQRGLSVLTKKELRETSHILPLCPFDGTGQFLQLTFKRFSHNLI